MVMAAHKTLFEGMTDGCILRGGRVCVSVDLNCIDFTFIDNFAFVALHNIYDFIENVKQERNLP